MDRALMASTYRDAAGMERPTQWERVHAPAFMSWERVTLLTRMHLPHGRHTTTRRSYWSSPAPLDAGERDSRGWCAGLHGRGPRSRV